MKKFYIFVLALFSLFAISGCEDMLKPESDLVEY